MRARLILLAVLIASPSWAEVSDKVPSTGDYVACAIGFNVVAFAVSRWRRWLAFVVASLALLFSGSVAYDGLLDPYVGPAIAVELGQSHQVAAWTS